MTEVYPVFEPETEPVEPASARDIRTGNDALLGVSYAAAGVVVAAEISPANEAIRGAVVTAAEVLSNSPFASASAYASATLAVEGSAAVATAWLMSSGKADQLIDWTSEKLEKHKLLSSDRRVGALGDLALGCTIGSTAAVVSKQIREPGLTFKDKAVYGLKNSAVVTAVTTPAIYGASKVAETIGWDNVALGGGAVVAAGAGAYLLNKNAKKRTDKAVNDPRSVTYGSLPNYELDEVEIEQGERQLVDIVRANIGRSACAVWLRSDDPLANIVRAHEAKLFPEIPDLMDGVEDTSRFMAVVDTRRSAGQGRVIRGTRLNSPMFNELEDEADPINDIDTIRGLIASGQITREDIEDYYSSHHFSLRNAISVETNFKIGERAKRHHFLPMAQLAYAAIVHYGIKHVEDGKTPSIIAHVNQSTVDSMSRAGFSHEVFAGSDKLYTPNENNEPDNKYRPVVYVYDEQAKKTMRRIDRIAKMPSIEL